MRAVIACNRRSKVKCKHRGQAPCAGCERTGHVDSCVLTGPEVSPRPLKPRLRASKRRRPTRAAESEAPGASTVAAAENDMKKVFSQVPRSHFIRALTLSQAQFPELGFLHPTDLDYDVATLSEAAMLRLLALSAISNRYAKGVDSAADACHKSLVLSELHKRLASPPNLCIIQTYLILTLCDWGDGDGFNAWMHAGIASRMAQGLLSPKLSSIGIRTLSEMEKRTLWSCFAIDKLLSCGKRRPAMFDLHSMDLPLPSNDDDFIFTDRNTATCMPSEIMLSTAADFGPDNGFLILVKGLHYWSNIHSWTAEGGRRQPGMAKPSECPWEVSSSWNSMKRDMQKWRDSQNSRLKYPESKVVSHAHVKQAEKFAHINLIYYVSMVFLLREYIPFFPIGELKPKGPIEAPLLEAAGPETFWKENVAELFYCSTQISNILRDLRHFGVPLQTPFTALCAFTSILTNLYAASFPFFMSFSQDQVSQAKAQAAESMTDLREIGRVWKIAHEWVEVADTARGLFHRATSGNGDMVRKSRYDYPELEDSINMAPLKGMPKPTFSNTRSNSTAEDFVSPVVRDPDLRELDDSYVGSTRQHQEQTSKFPDEGMDEDEWRRWLLWDDPHLLSTVVDPNLSFTGLEGGDSEL